MGRYTILPAVDLYICYQDRNEVDDKNPTGYVWKRVHYIRFDELFENEEYGVYKSAKEDEYTISHYSLEWISKYQVENLDDENPYENLNEKE